MSSWWAYLPVAAAAIMGSVYPDLYAVPAFTLALPAGQLRMCRLPLQP